MVEFDCKEYARQMRENAVKDNNGNIICSPELWEQIASIVENIPTADVQEVKHGEWIYKNRHRGGFERKIVYDDFGKSHTVTIDNRYECIDPYCSVCGKLGGDFLNYCGYCGAKMGGKEE